MRRTPIGRRTPLRGRPPEVDTGALVRSRRTGLRPRSPRAQRSAVPRRRLVEQLLAERPWCQARIREVCDGRAVDVHEMLRRSQGGDPLDPAGCITVCRRCHDWIGAHPTAAVQLGLARWRSDR